MIVEKYEAKTLVRTSTPSLFSWAEVYLNPYQGCYHDCKYCDGKSEGYYMHADFSERIRVKANAAVLLEQFLKNKGFTAPNRERTSTLLDYFPTPKNSTTNNPKFLLHIGGGVCDVYQPAEKEVWMTRGLLQIAHDYEFPVFILTKNDNALRDLDLLEKINRDNYACISFTITLADETTRQVFEPRASATIERFEAIKTLRARGIHSGVYFYPVLPFIGDTDENMHTIYRRAKEAGAEFVHCWGLTLKPGRNKQEFLQTLERHYPSLLPQYKVLYGNEDKYGNLDVRQLKNMRLVWPEIKGYVLGCETGMPYAAKRYVPKRGFEMNLLVSEILRKVAFIKGHILQRPRSETRKFGEAASYLDSFQQDISELNPEDFKKLPIAKETHEYILEFVNKGKSHMLEELEKNAFKRARDLLKLD